jgi:hypothetical protein
MYNVVFNSNVESIMRSGSSKRVFNEDADKFTIFFKKISPSSEFIIDEKTISSKPFIYDSVDVFNNDFKIIVKKGKVVIDRVIGYKKTKAAEAEIDVYIEKSIIKGYVF